MNWLLNKINCLFGRHVFTVWQCQSDAGRNCEAYFWYERKCVHCARFQRRDFRGIVKNFDTTNCGICNHAEHQAGGCKQCNCGSSEIIHPRSSVKLIEDDYGDYMTRIYNRSPVVRHTKVNYKEK